MRPTIATRTRLCLMHGPEDLRLAADLLGGRAGDDDRLGVDHLAHHAAARVGRGHQDGREPQPLGGDLLEIAEEGVRAGVGPGQGHAQPAEQRAEEREGGARCGSGSGRGPCPCPSSG